MLARLTSALGIIAATSGTCFSADADQSNPRRGVIAAHAEQARITEREQVTLVTRDGREIQAERIRLVRRACYALDVHANAPLIDPREFTDGREPTAIIAPTNRGSGFNLIFNTFGNVTPEALDGLQRTVDYYQTLVTDDTTIEIDMTFDPGAFGGTGTDLFSLDYEELRLALVNDADADDIVQALLPEDSFPARRSPGGTITDETEVRITQANALALGLATPDGVLASISVNDNLDFDPTDGIAGSGNFGNFSGVDILVHEVGHALGFINLIEFGQTPATSLDLFRFPQNGADNPGGSDNPGSAAQFASSPRALFTGVGVDQAFDNTLVEYPLSTADGFQASHWLETGAAGFNGRVGVMEPAIAPEENGFPDFFSDADINAFDAIGYDIVGDVPNCPADLAAPFGVLNFFDLGEFLTLFNAQDPSVDFAAPFGVFNFFDLGEYLTLFNQGCP